jgi:hypothetical protein
LKTFKSRIKNFQKKLKTLAAGRLKSNQEKTQKKKESEKKSRKKRKPKKRKTAVVTEEKIARACRVGRSAAWAGSARYRRARELGFSKLLWLLLCFALLIVVRGCVAAYLLFLRINVSLV